MRILALPYEVDWSIGFCFQDLAAAMAGRHTVEVRASTGHVGSELADDWDAVLCGDSWERVRVSPEMRSRTIAGVWGFAYFHEKSSTSLNRWRRRANQYRALGCIDPRTIETVSRYHNRIFWTPPGVPDMFSPSLTPDAMASGRLRVGWVGRPNWGGLAPGSPRDVKRLYMAEEAVRRLRGSAELVVTTDLRREEMPAFYRSLDVLVVTSRSETGPMPLLEALCCGVPVLTTDVGLSPLHVRHGVNGWFYDGTARGLHARLKRLTRHPAEVLAAKTEASRPAPLLRWPSVLPYWEDLLRHAIVR